MTENNRVENAHSLSSRYLCGKRSAGYRARREEAEARTGAGISCEVWL